MAFEHKPGQGSIFKNEKKQTAMKPDYRGTIVTPSGETLEISLWVKEGQRGKFFSAAVKPPYNQTAHESEAITPDSFKDPAPRVTRQAPPTTNAEQDDLPF